MPSCPRCGGVRVPTQGYCKPCLSVVAREWESRNPERAEAIKKAARKRWREKRRAQFESGEVRPPETKRCRTCHEDLPASAFNTNFGLYDGLQASCRSCGAENRKIKRLAIYEREGGRCHICGKGVSRDEFHVEHLFPAAAGGSNDPSNLAVAHPSCNARKGAKVMPVQLRIA